MEVITLKEECPIDVSRLDPDERRLWDEVSAVQVDPEANGPTLMIWSFGYICMFDLGRVPSAVTEYLSEQDPHNKIRQYLDNVRRARWEGRL